MKEIKNVFFINICYQNKWYKIKIEIEKMNFVKVIKLCFW